MEEPGATSRRRPVTRATFATSENVRFLATRGVALRYHRPSTL